MTRLLVTGVTVVSLLASQALGRDLTVNECLNLSVALRALDCAGRDMDAQRMFDGRPGGASALECKQYKLGSVRGELAFTLASLDSVQQKVMTARNDLISKIGGGKDIPHGSQGEKDFIAAFQKILDSRCDVTPPALRLDDLNLKENQIPLSVIAAMRPILSDIPVPPAPAPAPDEPKKDK